MKRMIKELAQFAGMMLVLAGLVVCMCETADLDKQAQTMLMGIAIIATGTVVSILENGGEKDELPR